MHFDMKQINNLCTGVKLASELKSRSDNLKKFITIYGYKYDDRGKRVVLEKILGKNKPEDIYFILHCYEISIDYYINNWDVTEDELENEIYIEDIKGVESLENAIRNYTQDLSIFQPEWECDNLL